MTFRLEVMLWLLQKSSVDLGKDFITTSDFLQSCFSHMTSFHYAYWAEIERVRSIL